MYGVFPVPGISFVVEKSCVGIAHFEPGNSAALLPFDLEQYCEAEGT